MGEIVRHQDLDVYKKSFAAAVRIFALSKSFPSANLFQRKQPILSLSRFAAHRVRFVGTLPKRGENAGMKPRLLRS